MEYNILMAKGLHYAVVDRRLLDTSKVHRRCRRADIAVPERRSGKKMEKKRVEFGGLEADLYAFWRLCKITRSRTRRLLPRVTRSLCYQTVKPSVHGGSSHFPATLIAGDWLEPDVQSLSNPFLIRS